MGYCPLLRLTTNLQRLTNAENGSQPFVQESRRWHINNKLTVYNHGSRFAIVHHDLQFGLQNKTKQNQATTTKFQQNIRPQLE